MDSIRQLRWDPRKALVRTSFLMMVLCYIMSFFEVDAKKRRTIIIGRRRRRHWGHWPQWGGWW